MRGEGSEYSALLKADGKMCPMGFYIKQFTDLTDEQIEDQFSPASVEVDCRVYPEWIISPNGRNSQIVLNIMKANDNENMLDCDKELELKKEFLKVGVKVEFVN